MRVRQTQNEKEATCRVYAIINQISNVINNSTNVNTIEICTALRGLHSKKQKLQRDVVVVVVVVITTAVLAVNKNPHMRSPISDSVATICSAVLLPPPSFLAPLLREGGDIALELG